MTDDQDHLSQHHILENIGQERQGHLYASDGEQRDCEPLVQTETA
jgi:hypothetical protein